MSCRLWKIKTRVNCTINTGDFVLSGWYQSHSSWTGEVQRANKTKQVNTRNIDLQAHIS